MSIPKIEIDLYVVYCSNKGNIEIVSAELFEEKAKETIVKTLKDEFDIKCNDYASINKEELECCGIDIGYRFVKLS